MEAAVASPVSPLCRAFLKQDYHLVHPRLPEWLKVLSEVGASECWHKKSTFKAHLFETYKMCKLWGFSDVLCETMLFHSAYSNSYVNLAVFKEDQDRPRLAGLVGQRTEQLIHLFCIVPRHELIYEKLLKVLPDDDDHEVNGNAGQPTQDGSSHGSPPPLPPACAPRLVVPRAGVVVPHIHTGQPLRLSQRVVAVFLALTMVDFSEQLMSWQDTMFENQDGKLYYAGHNAHVLWPAAMQPGLYHAALSRMGRLLRNTLQDIQQQQQQQDVGAAPQPAPLNAGGAEACETFDFSEIQVSIPPVYNHCTVLVHAADERRCRDLYWDVVSNKNEPQHAEEAERMLREACQLNPHVAEPCLLLAQLLLQRHAYEEAQTAAHQGLQLLCCWGTAYDKRMSWEAWVAWARVLLRSASTHKWPDADKPMGMLNLGLVDL